MIDNGSQFTLDDTYDRNLVITLARHGLDCSDQTSAHLRLGIHCGVANIQVDKGAGIYDAATSTIEYLPSPLVSNEDTIALGVPLAHLLLQLFAYFALNVAQRTRMDQEHLTK